MPPFRQKRRNLDTFGRTLFGDPQYHTLENRIFNAVLVMITFGGISATLLNCLSGNPVREIILTLVATAVPVGFYVGSRWHHADRYLNIPLFIIFLGLLSIAWFTNQGSDGSTLGYFFILFVVGKIVVSPPYDIWLLGLSFVVLVTLLFVEYLRPDLILPYLSESHMFFDKMMSLIICLVVITLLVHLILKEFKNERTLKEGLHQQTLKDKEALTLALAEIKMLRGVLPVCSFCKKIRDENDEWSTMEEYISSHSEAQFTHSFCPDCGRKHYPEYFKAPTGDGR